MNIFVPSSDFPDTEQVRARIASDGFAQYCKEDFGLTPEYQAGLEGLTCLDLPQDEHCAGDYRFRRYGKAWIVPGAPSIFPAPTIWDEADRREVQEYCQPVSLNPEHNGEVRRFAAITEDTFQNALLQSLIRFDFSCVSFSADELRYPIQVGIHIVRMLARPGKPAVSTPNQVHRDGEHYTCAHLLARHRVEGGRNWVTSLDAVGKNPIDLRDHEVLSSFILENPLDGYIVKDDLVGHAVGSVSVQGHHPDGYRTVLLIDFTPMKPFLLL